ncbi:MAG TPA: hypothetical protein VK982_15475 [Bacteroidales bacterium]|nr:hypothetical protein [Bacteroidales bacterium]
MAVLVPNTNNYGLTDVVAAVEDHAGELPGADGLDGCFDYSIEGYFDPDYNNNSYAPANSLKRFRNYGPKCWLSYIDYLESFNLGYNPRGVYIRPDGAKMFVVSAAPDSKIYSYELSVPWDLSTMSLYDTYQLFNSSHNYAGIYVEPNGYHFFIIDQTNSELLEFDMLTFWSLISPLNIKTISIQDGAIGIDFNPDGSSFVITSNDTVPIYPRIYQYNLSTSWDIDTASVYTYWNIGYNRPLTELRFSKNGERLFFLVQTTNLIVQIGLQENYNLSQGKAFDCNKFYSDTIDSAIYGIYIRDTEDDSLDLFITGDENNRLYHAKVSYNII